MKRQILVSGLGWISSGVISIAVYSLKASIAARACCIQNDYGLLYLGIFVILVGIALLAENKRIDKLMEKIKSRHRTSQGAG